MSGKEKTLSHTGYRVVVKVGERVYDAYTGAAGMKLADYLARFDVPKTAQIVTQVVQQP